MGKKNKIHRPSRTKSTLGVYRRRKNSPPKAQRKKKFTSQPVKKKEIHPQTKLPNPPCISNGASLTHHFYPMNPIEFGRGHLCLRRTCDGVTPCFTLNWCNTLFFRNKGPYNTPSHHLLQRGSERRSNSRLKLCLHAYVIARR